MRDKVKLFSLGNWFHTFLSVILVDVVGYWMTNPLQGVSTTWQGADVLLYPITHVESDWSRFSYTGSSILINLAI